MGVNNYLLRGLMVDCIISLLLSCHGTYFRQYDQLKMIISTKGCLFNTSHSSILFMLKSRNVGISFLF